MNNEDTILKNLKGTFDYFSMELSTRNYIIDLLKKNFELYGYLPLETPIVCYYDLLASKYAGGDEILKEVYKLTDQGDRSLALRYDLTVPFSKVIAMQKELSLPFKRYEIGKVFRDGPVKPGRNREFYQCDVDVVGISNLGVEIEFFQMINKVFNELDLDVEIHYNNRQFLVGLLTEIGILEFNITNVISAIDKILKIGELEVKKELLNFGINEEVINKLFNFLSYDFDSLVLYFKDTTNEDLKNGIKSLNEINDYVKSLGLKNCLFKPFLARGLEIYTGTVWEIFSKDGYRSSLGGGGRYDKIITNFINDGNIYPAVGMSFGLEPIYEVIKNKFASIKSNIKVLVYGFEIIPYIFEVTNLLRQNDIACLIELNNWKLKKALDYANKNEIPYVIIIGEDEINNQTVTLKDMNNKTQESIHSSKLVSRLK